MHVSYHHFDTDLSFVSRVNTQDNLITAPAEFNDTYDFAIYLCSQKYNRKIERSKNLPKCFLLMVIFNSRFEICCFHIANVVADGKMFHSRPTLPENLLLLFLKTVYQYLFTFSSTFVFYKAG